MVSQSSDELCHLRLVSREFRIQKYQLWIFWISLLMMLTNRFPWVQYLLLDSSVLVPTTPDYLEISDTWPPISAIQQISSSLCESRKVLFIWVKVCSAFLQCTPTNSYSLTWVLLVWLLCYMQRLIWTLSSAATTTTSFTILSCQCIHECSWLSMKTCPTPRSQLRWDRLLIRLELLVNQELSLDSKSMILQFWLEMAREPNSPLKNFYLITK